MGSFQIPWKCLDDSPTPIKTTINKTKINKTFAQVVPNVCSIPNSQLPQSVINGDMRSIEIPEHEYESGTDACKLNLHGKIIWPKGATPLTVFDLKKKLSQYWKNLSQWGITSLGRGYYEFIFTSLEDVKRVRSIASWNLSPGIPKLFAWSKDFSPKNQRNTYAQVWVRLYGLSQEYWVQNILFTIAGSLGSPICTDSTTAKPRIERTFGHYARVLVDMDVSQTIRYKLFVERKGYAFFVDVEYENLPDYCTNCKSLAHYVEICKKLNCEEVDVPMKETTAKMDAENKRKHGKNPKPVYVQTRDGRGIQGKAQNEVAEGAHVANAPETPDERLQREIDAELERQEKSAQSKSKTPILQEVEPIVNNNRFSALEDQLVENIENEMEENSSQDSEFVDATQMGEGNNLPEEEEEEEQEITEDRVKKNAEFLKQSWANIAEDEPAEVQFIRESREGTC